MNNNEPIVLGKIEKGKTGKPIVVVIIFLFIGAILFFLPSIMNYFGDYNIIDLIKNGQIIDFIQNHDNYIQGNIHSVTTTEKPKENEPLLINNKTIIEYNNFTLSNFNLKQKEITFTIKTSNTLNLDDSNYYLVLSKDNKELLTLKLIGEINKEKEITLLFNKKIDNTIDIKGIVKEIKKEDYPNVTIYTDESGLGTITCINDSNSIEYTFNNNNLISIKDTFTYIDKNDGNYLKKFEEYNNISNELNNLGAISTIAETNTSFIMITNIDLNIYQYNKKNTNYYSLNTKAKVVNFEMEAKGFDCK